MRSASSLTVLAGVSVGAWGLACGEPRYELVAGKLSNTSEAMYRLDRATGEVCAFLITAGKPEEKHASDPRAPKYSMFPDPDADAKKPGVVSLGKCAGGELEK